MKTEHRIKLTVEGKVSRHNLSIDWENLTEEEMRELAARSIVIKYQNECRSSKVVPGENPEIDAKDYALGVRKAAATPEQVLSKLAPEEAVRLLKELIAKQEG